MKAKITLSQKRTINGLYRFGYFQHSITPSHVIMAKELRREPTLDADITAIVCKFVRITRRGKVID